MCRVRRSDADGNGVNIAIVGSRAYPRLDQVKRYVGMLPGIGVTVLSGGAQGVDTAAQDEADEQGIPTRIFLPEWGTLGRRAGVVRNAQLVDAADLLVAFWDGESRGTRNAIHHARNMVKPFVVVFP